MTKPMTENKRARHFLVIDKDLGKEGGLTNVTYLCSSEKPREQDVAKWPDSFIHVIEYSEVDGFEAENKELKEKIASNVFGVVECSDENTTKLLKHIAELQSKLHVTNAHLESQTSKLKCQVKNTQELHFENLELTRQNKILKEMLIGKIMDENHDEMHPTAARAMAEAEIDEALKSCGKIGGDNE